MRGEIITIATDGTLTRGALDGVDNLSTLQAEVGGLIGFVPRFGTYDGRECDAYVNDEGLFLGLPENPEATRLWRAQIKASGGPALGDTRLHGPLAIVTGDEDFMRASREG